MAWFPHALQMAAWYSRGPPLRTRFAAARQLGQRWGTFTSPFSAKKRCSPPEKMKPSPQSRHVRVRSSYTAWLLRTQGGRNVVVPPPIPSARPAPVNVTPLTSPNEILGTQIARIRSTSRCQRPPRPRAAAAEHRAERAEAEARRELVAPWHRPGGDDRPARSPRLDRSSVRRPLARGRARRLWRGLEAARRIDLAAPDAPDGRNGLDPAVRAGRRVRGAGLPRDGGSDVLAVWRRNGDLPQSPRREPGPGHLR